MIRTLELNGVAIRRGGRLLFEGVDLTLAAGEACALTGANGVGKTSLLRCVAGLVRPEAGAVAFGGLEPSEARGGGLHFVGHHDGLKPARTAREELTFWTRWCGGGDPDAAVEALELAPLLDLEVRRLSAGQRRRVALARMLAAPRPLWLLDEPASALDREGEATLALLLRDHVAAGGVVIAAVHGDLPIAPDIVLDLAGSA